MCFCVFLFVCLFVCVCVCVCVCVSSPAYERSFQQSADAYLNSCSFVLKGRKGVKGKHVSCTWLI